MGPAAPRAHRTTKAQALPPDGRAHREIRVSSCIQSQESWWLDYSTLKGRAGWPPPHISFGDRPMSESGQTRPSDNLRRTTALPLDSVAKLDRVCGPGPAVFLPMPLLRLGPRVNINA
jgi:hypothetical protein